MHIRRSSVFPAVATLFLIAGPAWGFPHQMSPDISPSRAAQTDTEPGTHCTFQLDVVITPGLSAQPSSGTFTSEGETGTVLCDGPVNGKHSTAAGTFGVQGTYGGDSGNTCLSGAVGHLVQDFTIPTAEGRERIISRGSYAYGASYAATYRGSRVSPGRFEGDRFSGTFDVTPSEGDCIMRPLTRARVKGEGILHS